VHELLGSIFEYKIEVIKEIGMSLWFFSSQYTLILAPGMDFLLIAWESIDRPFRMTASLSLLITELRINCVAKVLILNTCKN
jgi:hypothetical protein